MAFRENFMTMRDKPPFRADHVGSLLRPKTLLDARDRHEKGEIDDAALRAIEDASIRDAVKLQEDVGLEAITDGEHRRTLFHIDFMEKLDGITISDGKLVSFHSHDEKLEFAPPTIGIGGKLRHRESIQGADFDYLKSQTSKTAKVCIPSPSMAHFRVGRRGIPTDIYPDIEEFFDDLATAYRAEIADLAARGCRYVQLDDTNLAYLCDPAVREQVVAMGEDPDELPHTYAKLINDSIKDRPDDMVAAIHLCRGNFKSAWVAEGGYDPVADSIFNEIAVDGFFLEYENERSGGFEPLRFVPKGKTVVLGIVSSKLADMESKDFIKGRIDEAAKYLDLDQMALSPQCGFSSTVHGNQITVDDQIGKLRLCVETAQDVWG
jgi:5-methyltetrahydropteroyltriglutamate--homocysteine methyltransferase